MEERLRAVTVIEGEASESDGEYEETMDRREKGSLSESTPPRSNPANDFGHQSGHTEKVNSAGRSVTATAANMSSHLSEDGRTGGLLVSGEASESEDEFEMNHTPYQSSPLHLNTPLKVEIMPGITKSHLQVKRANSTNSQNQPASHERFLKYESLLHKKLKETNERLKNHIEVAKGKHLESATRDFRNISALLSKSQAIIKEICTAMRITSNDLFHMEDKLDIVTSCSLIPYINIAPSQNVRTLSKPSISTTAAVAAPAAPAAVAT